MLSKILKREWVTIMNNVFDISLNVLVDCVNEKKDFSLLIKEYTKNVKLNDYKKTCLSICGIVLRNYYLIKYFANHVLKFTDTRLVLATGIVFGTVAFKKVEDTSSCLEWYKNLLITIAKTNAITKHNIHSPIFFFLLLSILYSPYIFL